jgi:hypothetical protein
VGLIETHLFRRGHRSFAFPSSAVAVWLGSRWVVVDSKGSLTVCSGSGFWSSVFSLSLQFVDCTVSATTASLEVVVDGFLLYCWSSFFLFLYRFALFGSFWV